MIDEQVDTAPDVDVDDPGENEKLKKFYESLVASKYAVPSDYGTFEKVLQDPEKAKSFHQKLVADKFSVPGDYEQFSAVLGLKKKEETQPPAVGIEPAAEQPDGSDTGQVTPPASEPVKISAKERLDKKVKALNSVYEQGFLKEIQPFVDKAQDEYDGQVAAKRKELQGLVNSGKLSSDQANKQLNKFGNEQGAIFDEKVRGHEKKYAPEFEKKYGKQVNDQLTRFQDDYIKDDFQENKERNPAVSVGKSLWNTFRYQLPADLISGQMAMEKFPHDITEETFGRLPESVQKFLGTSKETHLTSKTGIEWLDRYLDLPDELPKNTKETAQVTRRKGMLLQAFKMRNQGEEANKHIVNTLDKAEDFVDYLNWAGASLGQAAGQIPAAIVSRGATAYGQEIGSIYFDAVNKIAAEKKLTPEQVIEQGLDETIMPVLMGAVAGKLEYVGAGKVAGGFMSTFTKEEVVKSLRQRTLASLKAVGVDATVEALTEGSQSVLEQLGASTAAGKGWLEAIKELDPVDVKESFAQGFVGGGGIHSVGLGLNAGYNRIVRNEAQIQPKVNVKQAPQPEIKAEPPAQPATQEKAPEVQPTVTPKVEVTKPVEKPKPSENAVPEQSTDEVPVRKTSGNSETVEQGVSQPGQEESTGTQGGQTESAPQNKPEVPSSGGTSQESQVKVKGQPVEDISVDHKRFQNRDEAFSKKSVDRIVTAVMEGKFDINEFDPIRTWKDPKNGKTYVLSGHSRTEAFRRLQGMLEKGEIPKEVVTKLKEQGIEDFKHIPAIDVSNKTEEEAKKFAEASNTLATQESDLERAKLIKKKRTEGQSITSIRKETGATRSQELLSHLKQGGQAWDAIKAMENSETAENKRRVYQVGEFLGQARYLFPQLTDSHENEMYDYLTKGKGQTITTRDEFINRIDNVVNNIGFQSDPGQALNLDNRVSRGSNESEAIQAHDEILKNIRALEKERSTKDIKPGRLSEVTRELGKLHKDLITAKENITKAKAGDKQQFDLFGNEIKTENKQESEGTAVPNVSPGTNAVDGGGVTATEADSGKGSAAEKNAGEPNTVSTESVKPTENESGTANNLEPDSTRNAPAEQVGKKNVSKERGTSGTSTESGSGESEESGVPGQGDLSFSDRIPVTDGKPADTGVVEQDQPTGPTERIGRGADNTGSSANNESGIQPKPNTAKQPQGSTHAEGTSGLDIDRKLQLQREAEGTSVVIKDKGNIAQTLPVLLPHQLTNVLKAETRFFNPPKEGEPNKGILFTDGTGTGKTYTGLGIAKRFVKMGKPNILIVVPSESKTGDWIGDGKNLLLDIQKLQDTKSAGAPGTQVATTYANFRANEALQKRVFDLVIYDESHKLVSNEQGEQTEADRQHKELTNSPRTSERKAREKFQSLIDQDYKDLGRISDKTQSFIDKEKARLLDQTKVVFLSATPFAYHKNLRYGDGYLFTIQEGVKEKGSRSYNEPNAEQAFFIKNFGYRMHYNKLTVPETGVDQSLMERVFHTSLIKSGAVSSKKLELDKDYSREFVLIDDKLGLDIDEGIKLASDRKYRFLPSIVDKKFNYLYKNQLLESIKARNVLDRIKDHVKLGRKVVVFHSYVNSLPSHPFDLDIDELSYENDRERRAAQTELDSFNAENPKYRALDLRSLINPVQTLKNAFGDKLLIFNGTIPSKQRKSAIKEFNTDGSGQDIIIIQIESGKEGISLHDVTGVHQRAEIHLELPTRPTDAIQSEGRVYRIGQMSDAIIEYAVLHLDFEKFAFANKINTRVKTAENLAFGEEARNLEDAFKEGYKTPNQEQPREDQGKGGKETDNSFETIDQFDKAKSFYYGRGKRTAKTKAKEGTDYYATPEPLGLKMVEWLQPQPNDELLEPSAGHGAIARWFPGDTKNKFIEQSESLRPDLAINVTGEVLTERDFEDLHPVNKFHGIAMNPPFGHAGKTAWDHVVKAMDHLKDGGRVIAIVPEGPSMQKWIDKWLEDQGLGLIKREHFIRAIISLPSVTFERAGTGVKTQILIIDRIQDPGQQQQVPQTQNRDWSRFENTEDFFDHLREQEVPDKIKPMKTPTEVVQSMLRSGTVTGVVKKETSTVPSFEVIEGKHTKNGTTIFTVKMNKRLTEDEYRAAKSKASDYSGYYSSFRGNGAIPGFIFKTQDAAKKMFDFLNGNRQEQPSAFNNEPEGYLSMPADASKGRTPLSAFETRLFNEKGKPFKLYQKVIDLAHKYNPNATLGQNNNVRGNAGTFYKPSSNLRVKGLSDLSVAMHEIVHALDFQFGVVNSIINGTKPGSLVRNKLTEIYVRYYPKALPGHDLYRRMVEGYATLMEKFIVDPTEIEKDYPELVKELIRPGGSFSFEKMQTFLREVDEIVKAYQSMEPLDKIGTRVVNERMDDDQVGYLTPTDKVTREIFDALWPIEKLAKKQGTQMTQEDISLWMRLSNNALQLAQKNISSKKNEFWSMDAKGNWSKKYDFNFNTLVRGLEKRGLGDDFAHYLVARRIYNEYQERNKLQDKLDRISNNPANPSAGDAYVQKLMQQHNIPQTDAEALAEQQRAALQEQIDRLNGILENDQIAEGEAEAAFNSGKDIFANDEQMFDALTQENLEFAHNPLVQLLDDEGYKKMTDKEGYAPFKRQMYDELVGEVTVPALGPTMGKTRLGSLQAREGSQKPIINPVIGAMANHQEFLRKGMKQMVYNKFLDVVKHNPDLFQVLQLQATDNPANRFPQEKDPNIIMARKDFKRVPILASKEIKSVLDENYQYHNMHVLEQTGITMSQMFRTGTTGVFWQFFINNIFLDQFSAGTNTRNGLFPFGSSTKNISRALLQPQGKEAGYLKEYMFLAGSSQTFLSADITSTKNLEDRVFGEKKTWGRKVADFFGFVTSLLSAPGNASEIMTRGTEYILARKAGKSQIVALEEAGRVSTPFHHVGRLGGSVGKSYVRSVPYFNSSLQVLRQSARTLNTKEGRTRYAFAALSMIAAAATTTLYLLGMDDDDEQKRLLKTLPPDELSKHLYFPNPYSSKRLLQVRVPEQLGFLSALTMMYLVEGADQTDYGWGEYGEAGASFMPTQLNPFNPTQMLFSYVPPLPKTTVETMMGIKTYPNIRPIETEHDKSLPPEYRYNAFTSPVAIQLGQTFGLSPKKIDHFLEGSFGRSVKYLTGKPGAYGIGQIFTKELYQEASRQVQLYYHVKEKNTRLMRAYENGYKDLSHEQVVKMERIDDVLSDIEAYMGEYKEVDPQKQPMLSTRLRNEIFKSIRALEKLDE